MYVALLQQNLSVARCHITNSVFFIWPASCQTPIVLLKVLACRYLEALARVVDGYSDTSHGPHRALVTERSPHGRRKLVRTPAVNLQASTNRCCHRKTSAKSRERLGKEGESSEGQRESCDNQVL